MEIGISLQISFIAYHNKVSVNLKVMFYCFKNVSS